MKRNPLLFIGGLDPSAGAGILADAKTAEQCLCYGVAVATALTYQTDMDFFGLQWHTKEQVVAQMDPLLGRFDIKIAKISFVQNLEFLSFLVEHLQAQRPQIKIVWDPIVSTSTGFMLHDNFEHEMLASILEKLFLVTPNFPEIRRLFPFSTDEMQAAQKLSERCAVLLKGGHAEGEFSTDYLFLNSEREDFKHRRIKGGAKHGSGCVFGAALCSALTHLQLREAVPYAQKYIQQYLESDPSLLGFHAQEGA
ncbi:MAG: hydroxymethylpyrimidine/phosphomethylpyrimidine kinase [Bdellovibrionales bacterium]|nr:hydroxymethylpyrimidine/phosphomethylpyrimidine kinase [Bdellovibrionales bacterium]